MSLLPWRRDRDAEDPTAASAAAGEEPLIVCEFQDGTLSVYADRVHIERAGPSSFADKTIPRDEITDARFSSGLVISHLQIEQVGFENDTGGFLSAPVDENTLHGGRGVKDCAERVVEELRFGDG